MLICLLDWLGLNFWLNLLFCLFYGLGLSAFLAVLFEFAFENDLVALLAPCVDSGALNLVHPKLGCIDFLVTSLAKFHFC